jgi:hypothetical protein
MCTVLGIGTIGRGKNGTQWVVMGRDGKQCLLFPWVAVTRTLEKWHTQ